MNRPAVLAMATTASGGVSLLAIAWLAARYLTGAELGFFFSFLSFGALVQLGDFGLSYAALQTAAHLAGTGRSHELPALSKRLGRWNLLATCVATLVVAALGWMTFSRANAPPAMVAWTSPWLAYLLAVFANQQTVPRLALREGGGKISQMWGLRLVQEWAAGIVCLLTLYAGGGLWSLAAFVATRALVAGTWLTFGDPLKGSSDLQPYSLQRWMAEVWPFQWKIGLSGLAGFLIFRAFAPIILLEKGPVLAGQFGLAVSLMNLLIAVTAAWPQSQAARYAALNAVRKYEELRNDFPRMLWSSTALAAVATAALTGVLLWARNHGVSVAMRLPDPGTTAVILGTAVVHHFVACYAVFLRAEGREPLLVASVVGGLATVSVIWWTAHLGSLRDVSIVNLASTMVGIPIVLYLFRSRMKGRSHANSGA